MTATTLDLDTDLLRLEVDDDGIATVWIDDPSASVNKISEAMLEAFNDVLERLETDGSIRGAVFISGKDNTFIVGADIEMLRAFESREEARSASRLGHRMVARVQNLSIPTVAAIHGPCMGGGTEFSLGCSYRIATHDDATKLALPEVKLGLLPGSGGTQYLPRLVGVQQALTMMLTGKNMYPKKAKRIGLVDALIHPPGLHRAATAAARGLARGEISPQRNDQPLANRLLESNTVSRRIIYQQAAKRTAQRTRGNYPAPPKIIECVKVGMEQGLEEGLDAETRHFADLMFTPESRALVSLFFAKQKGDTNPYHDAAHAIDTIGVLGAGLMGGGIAQVSASNDLDVVLKDQSLALAAGGKKHAWKALNKKASKGILSEFQRDRIAERIVPTEDYAPLHGCDVVIEAVPENLDLKRAVLAETEAVIRDDAVFASNTSSIPIADIAAEAEHPERVLGMHYFSPVPQMPLLEIIVTEDTSDAALATAYEAGVRQGKTVIVVNDGPGFYTTRILAIYMNEALLLLEEGADAEAIDEAMQDWGFPMGPFELFDLVGIDVAAKITEVMKQHLDMERLDISDSAATLVEADLLGQKTNRGFYIYDEDDPSDDKDPEAFNTQVYHYFGGTERTKVPDYVVKERLGMMMVNESIRCLEEGILNDPVDGDLGAVFGLGFPPFRGGPFRYVDQEGAATTHTRLERLTRQHGDRFTPAPLLAKHAEHGTPFHTDGDH
jgi:3-hydroxyacyl-CoA dehydrogenase/enoyl-CoA hydratase/3-hydroxybutyryl-CoA epimerase